MSDQTPKDSPLTRMRRRSLNFAGWTCTNCKALNSDYTESVVTEDAAHVKTISSGTQRTTCVKCGYNRSV